MRGAALVAEIIAHATTKRRIKKPSPLTPAQIDAMERDAGAALPPSLRAWLLFDAGWLAKSMGALDPRKPRASSLRSVIAAHAGAMAKVYEPLVRARFPDRALALDAGSDSMRILRLGDPDVHGETPVLEIDLDDGPELGIAFAGFDLWLASELDVAVDLDVDVELDRDLVAKRVLGRTGRIDCARPVPKKLGPIVRASKPGAWVGSDALPRRPTNAKLATRVELGVPLIERVITRVQREGLALLGARGVTVPRPISADVLKKVRFPRQKYKLSPSLLRWLAFDGSWLESLGWFAAAAPLRLAPQKLDAFAVKELGPPADKGGAFGPFAERLDGELYPLPADGTRAVALYVDFPDSAGEHAVMQLDLTDGPRASLLYPGFDVFMAQHVGLWGDELPALAEVARSVAYKTRMREQQYRGFASKTEYRLRDLP